MSLFSPEDLKSVLTDPRNIVKELDKYIIGQENAKISLSLMILRRALIRLQRNGNIPKEPLFDKSNVLIIGNTGTGKTALVTALSKINGSPIGISDITDVTAAGYIGGKVEEILERYVLLCESWVNERWTELTEFDEEDLKVHPSYNSFRYAELVREEVEKGIIYIDEIDKIRQKSEERDVNGNMVQNELLKFFENGNIQLWNNKGSRHDVNKSTAGIEYVDTTCLTFICGGAFQGLTDTISRRLKVSKGIGFNSDLIVTDQDELMSLLTTEDLIEYGFKPEFLGRLQLRTFMNKMTIEMMERIITEPNGNLYDQYKLAFKLFNIDFSIDKEALRYLAERALQYNTGARSLKQIFTKLLTDSLYNIYDLEKEFKIGLEYIKERL